jgi:co-chaperonin GroES (HSP10)
MIEPLGHRLLVKPDDILETDEVYKKATASGIVLADHDDRKREQAGMDRGTVILIGQSAFRDFGTTAWCDVGDYIAYARHAGKWVKDPETNVDYLIINDEDVVCRFTSNKG